MGKFDCSMKELKFLPQILPAMAILIEIVGSKAFSKKSFILLVKCLSETKKLFKQGP